MLLPKKTKFRKVQRGRRRGQSKGQTTVQFGEYGLKALEVGWVTNRQIEAARIAMTRKIRRGGKVWINVFPDKAYTKKPAETRMGSGKGSPDFSSFVGSSTCCFGVVVSGASTIGASTTSTCGSITGCSRPSADFAASSVRGRSTLSCSAARPRGVPRPRPGRRR